MRALLRTAGDSVGVAIKEAMSKSNHLGLCEIGEMIYVEVRLCSVQYVRTEDILFSYNLPSFILRRARKRTLYCV